MEVVTFTAQEKANRFPLTRRLGVPQNSTGPFGDEKNL
jgi:hypothetical protein